MSTPKGLPQGDAAKNMEPRKRRTVVTPFPGKGAGGMAESNATARGFSARLIRWHKHHGRHDLPWQKTSTDCTDIDHARTVLDEDHYGLQDVKERIIEFLAVRKVKKDGKDDNDLLELVDTIPADKLPIPIRNKR